MAASTPEAVTRGLTLKGAELSWSILEGRKVVENRSRLLPRGWVALHTGEGTIAAAHLRTVKSVCADLPSEGTLPRGVGREAAHGKSGESVGRRETTSETWMPSTTERAAAAL